MSSLAHTVLAPGFLLMAAARCALTLREPKATPAAPRRAPLREPTGRAEEHMTLQRAAAVPAGFSGESVLLTFL